MTFVSHFNQITNTLTEKFRAMADGKTLVNLFNEINRATLDAIALVQALLSFQPNFHASMIQFKIAFGMQTDAVNQKQSILNEYLSRVLQISMANILDPFMSVKKRRFLQLKKVIFNRVLFNYLYLKYKPWKFREIRDFKMMVRYLRKLGKEKIVERITAFKKNEHMPDDILSAILTSFSKKKIVVHIFF